MWKIGDILSTNGPQNLQTKETKATEGPGLDSASPVLTALSYSFPCFLFLICSGDFHLFFPPHANLCILLGLPYISRQLLGTRSSPAGIIVQGKAIGPA